MNKGYSRASVAIIAVVFTACAGGLLDPDGGGAHDRRAALEGFVLADAMDNAAVHVSTLGTDDKTCGSVQQPCRSITYGMEQALSLGVASAVRVAGGEYAESIDLLDGVSIFGGFSSDFKTGLGADATIINGTLLSGEAIALRAESIRRPTEVAHLTLRATDGERAGGSSYGVLVGDSPALSLKDLVIIAGAGSPGAKSNDGAKGDDGEAGTLGANAGFFLAIPLGCSPMPGAGIGGTTTCGSAGGKGGGGAVIDIFTLCYGEAGFPAEGVLGATLTCSDTTKGQGGIGGNPGREDNCAGTITTVEATPGTDGCAGSLGEDGVHGRGGLSMGTFDQAGIYLPADGATGLNGEHGGGGGGGGGGGEFEACDGGVFHGAGGGGGGAGGCGGEGGEGGKGGGGSFGIVVRMGHASLSITGCQVETGAGAKGGDGGAAGASGSAGVAGNGGAAWAGATGGGKGGPGGASGAGGPGGGGGGGPSIGLVVGEGPMPWVVETTFKVSTAGLGGGSSQTGEDGAQGMSQDTYTSETH
ncbi:MAG: hypothetical protein JRH20_09640 [Deltaproteobacteria bacterium]|nr:hypothetical protein [Deltaproteobacteria bacterium]